MLLSTAMVWGSGCDLRSPCECPATYIGVALGVVAVPDGPIAGVAVGFTCDDGNAAVACQEDQIYQVTSCLWSNPGPETTGNHACSLIVSAPGYQPVQVPATITVNAGTPGEGCDCGGARLDPPTIALEPVSDGGE